MQNQIAYLFENFIRQLHNIWFFNKACTLLICANIKNCNTQISLTASIFKRWIQLLFKFYWIWLVVITLLLFNYCQEKSTISVDLFGQVDIVLENQDFAIANSNQSFLFISSKESISFLTNIDYMFPNIILIARTRFSKSLIILALLILRPNIIIIIIVPLQSIDKQFIIKINTLKLAGIWGVFIRGNNSLNKTFLNKIEAGQ